MTCISDCHAATSVAVTFFLMAAVVGSVAAYASAQSLWFTLPYTLIAATIWITGDLLDDGDRRALLATTATMVVSALPVRRLRGRHAATSAPRRRVSLLLGAHAYFLAFLIVGYSDAELRIATDQADGALLRAWVAAAPASLLLALALAVASGILIAGLWRRSPWTRVAVAMWVLTLGAVFAPLVWDSNPTESGLVIVSVIMLPTLVPLGAVRRVMRAEGEG